MFKSQSFLKGGQMNNSKKAVSEVVSVVLIIMITVAAIAVLWTIVIPMINNSLSSGTGCFKANADVTLLNKGFTCINRTVGANPNVFVQIGKGADYSVTLVGVQVLLSLPNGNTLSNETTLSMSANEEKTLNFSMTAARNATEISIAPIITSGKNPKACATTQKVTLQDC